MTINPYDLLGIDPHKSTLKELKKKYYELALLVHPDKNNVQNGDDMCIVHMAYKYCMEQMQLAKDKETSVEELEEKFENFCKMQQEEPPPFRDIMEDALELKRFNELFEQSEGFKASFENGYGDMMETDPVNLDYIDVEEKPLKNSFNSLIVYTEPISYGRDFGDFYDYTRKEPVNSYTVYNKNVCLTDYKEANSDPKLEEDTNAVMKLSRTFEQLLQERKTMDDTFEQSNQLRTVDLLLQERTTMDTIMELATD
jgi:curved DNA-binding protein CbpA